MQADGLQLSIGMRLLLHRLRGDGVTEVLPALLVDCIDGQELIIQAPDADHLAAFTVGATYTTRLVGAGRRYAFSARVLGRDEAAPHRVHLSYPQEVDGAVSRRAPRLGLTRPLRLSLHTEDTVVAVELHDISRSGACLIADRTLARHGDTLSIEFRIPSEQSLVTLHCLVRYILAQPPRPGGYRHGVEFQFKDGDEQLQLEQFIEFLLHERYTHPHATH